MMRRIIAWAVRLSKSHAGNGSVPNKPSMNGPAEIRDESVITMIAERFSGSLSQSSKRAGTRLM